MSECAFSAYAYAGESSFVCRSNGFGYCGARRWLDGWKPKWTFRDCHHWPWCLQLRHGYGARKQLGAIYWVKRRVEVRRFPSSLLHRNPNPAMLGVSALALRVAPIPFCFGDIHSCWFISGWSMSLAVKNGIVSVGCVTLTVILWLRFSRATERERMNWKWRAACRTAIFHASPPFMKRTPISAPELAKSGHR